MLHALGIALAMYCAWKICGEIDTAHRNEINRIKEDQDNG